MSANSTEKMLKALQGAMRAPSNSDESTMATAMTIAVPEDLANPSFRTLLLNHDDRQLLEKAKRRVVEDLRFEYLNDQRLKRALRRFVCASSIDRQTDHVASFVAEFAREPVEGRCYFPLLYLTIPEPYELDGVLFLPLGDGRIPANDHLDITSPCGGVASAVVRGTDAKLMMQRARSQVEHALRVIRVALRKHSWLHHSQLRFHLGETYVLDNRGAGWQRREDAPFKVSLAGEMRSLVEGQPFSGIPYQTITDVDTKAKLALKWIDRACLATDRLEATLYLFFALEGLLGDRSDKLKAQNLVFRRTVLGHVVEGSFPDPLRVYYLYEEVRSNAVHGSEAPDVSRRELSSFSGNVRGALNEFLAFAKSRGFTKRSQVVSALIRHDDAPQTLEWLRQRDLRWQQFDPFKD